MVTLPPARTPHSPTSPADVGAGTLEAPTPIACTRNLHRGTEERLYRRSRAMHVYHNTVPPVQAPAARLAARKPGQHCQDVPRTTGGFKPMHGTSVPQWRPAIAPTAAQSRARRENATECAKRPALHGIRLHAARTTQHTYNAGVRADLSKKPAIDGSSRPIGSQVCMAAQIAVRQAAGRPLPPFGLPRRLWPSSAVRGGPARVAAALWYSSARHRHGS